MHPLHDYVAEHLAEKLKSRKIVVWYDVRAEFAPFIAEIRGGARTSNEPVLVSVAGIPTLLAEYAGSMFELRAVVEPHVSGDTPETLVIYLPGCARDRKGSVLMELELAGWCYEPQLKSLARHALRRRLTDGTIDDLLRPESVGYEEIAHAASDSGAEPPSVLKMIFHRTPGNDAMVAAWLASEANDAEIESKGAATELVKLVRARLGLDLPADAGLEKLRAITWRYVLANDFRLDLRCPPPPSVEAIPTTGSKGDEEAVRGMARLLRSSHADAYVATAGMVESSLGLRDMKLPSGALGSIDTFAFEERALLACCGDLVAEGRFDEALTIVAEREQSFWLERDFERKAHWEACRRMAQLGKEAAAVREALATAGTDPARWVADYTRTDGWHHLDLLQRRLEALLTGLEGEPEARALGLVRQAYEDAQHAMALGFTKALREAGWTVPGTLQQTRVFSEMVSAQPRPVAYFLVDAMRFEMGVELAARLPKGAEVDLRPAIAALPSITPVGMGALMPEASRSFAVVEEGGKLGARIDGAFLPDVTARRKFAAARVPKLVDVTLDDLLSLPATKLKKKLEDSQIVVVRSQEIDHAGESGFGFQARQVMDTVIDNLVRAIRKLAAAGIERAVVCADHGHVFFPAGRDEAMRTDSPGGAAVELHRRCWIGRGGTTPPGAVRVPASALGYASDLDFVFPEGGGVFKSGGDLAFHHGGPSLQELIVPVVTVRMPGAEPSLEVQIAVNVSGLPAVIVNRIVTFTDLSLFDRVFVPALVSDGRRVGGVFGAVGGAETVKVDRDAGTVSLVAGVSVTIALLLADDSVKEVRVVLVDPATDAELYRSPGATPVKLGV